VGTNDLEKARGFYDDTLGALGVGRLMAMDDRAVWGDGAPEFMVIKPIDGGSASHANGGTIGFLAADQDAVDRFHAAALAKGGTCEGKPGLRPLIPGLYAAYVRDPDGNKICAINFGKAE
jgi:catechol 2,3-dioxygenase-like lactoylglutathione lyase family enzyme